MKVRKRREKEKPVSPYDYGFRDGVFVTCDPGLGGTGYAVWEYEDFYTAVEPIDSGTFNSKASTWHDQACDIAFKMVEKLRYLPVREFFYELPQFFEGSGMVTARRGDLVKLTSTAGIIAGAVFSWINARVVPIEVNTWKGQLKKDRCELRIRKRLPNYETSSGLDHEWDAVGIGLFVKGLF